MKRTGGRPVDDNPTVRPRQPASKNPVAVATPPVESAFAEVVRLIEQARQRAYQAVNSTMVDLYWQLGEYLHLRIEADGWAKGTVVQLASYIAQRAPGARGYSPQNLWRMRQFYETYRDDAKRSPLVRVLPWTQLPDRQMLAAKLHEFYALSAPATAPPADPPAKRPRKRRSP